MSYWRSLLFGGLACLSVLLVAAPRLHTPPPTAPPPDYPLCPDPLASQALDRALAALDGRSGSWLRAGIWQQVAAPPLVFQADGTYLAGPDDRLRIDLQVRFEGARRRLQIVCDGQTLWEAEQADGKDWQAFMVDVKRLRGELDSRTTPQARAEFYRAQLVTGPRMLLESLQKMVIFTHTQTIRWQNRDVILLSGARAASAPRPWPDYTPRQCRVVLDATTYWPRRVEWWGPAPSAAGDVRLCIQEFRDPIMERPLANEMFTFSAIKGELPDRTEAWTEQLRNLSGH
jgi:hypothetical protein